MKKLILMGCFLLFSAFISPAQSTVETKILGKGIYRISIDSINGAVLIDSLGNTLLSDSFKEEQVPLLLEELRKLGSKQIVYIINSHFHGDHCGGNKAINEGIVIAHINTKKSLESDHISLFWQDTSKAFLTCALPDITFTDKMTIHFADEEIDLIPFTGGHTNSDIIVYFKKSKIMLISDLLFSIGFPAIDAERGGNPVVFADNLKKIIDEYPDDLIFVAGHGKEFSKSDIKEYQEMIENSTEIVVEAMKKGLNIEQIKQRKILDKWSRYSHGYFSCDDWAEILYYSIQWADSLCEYFNQTNTSAMYIDNNIPGTEPLIFAPGVITTQVYEGCSGFNKEMDKFYFQRWIGNFPNLFLTERKQSKWLEPRLIKNSFKAPVYDFTISPDGMKLVFASPEQIGRLGTDQKGHNIFLLEKKDNEWIHTSTFSDSKINTIYHDSYPCLAENGNLYFFSNRPGGYGKTDIYFSENKDGNYTTPINMGERFNTNFDEWDPFIAPDENYLIFCSKKPGGNGEDDLYISFKNKNAWSLPINMGNKINTKFSENRPYVTPDGKYMFFTRNIFGNRDIYWISGQIIEELKPKE